MALPLHGQQTLDLEAGDLAAAVHSNHGRLGPVVIEERSTGHRVVLDEAFQLKLADGSTLRASQMQLSKPAEAAEAHVDATTSRAAAHLPGREVCADLADERSGSAVHWCMIARTHTTYLRQEVTIHAGAKALPLSEVRLLDFADPSAHVVGTVAGSPIVSGNLFFGFEHPLSMSAVQGGRATAGLKRILPLAPTQGITYSSVIGVSRPGQMRRDFLNYVELERAHPYRTFLHYNTWYDLGEGNRFGAADVLNRMNAFGEELVRKRGVTMDSFLMDDGWDNTSSLWQFNKGFPDGFTPLRATAEKYGFGLGVWFSPWGGYEQEKQERIAYGKSQGYEIVKDGYALSGPRYYAKFEAACLNFITKYGVNQFKIDGTGNADQVFPGSIFDSDFSAAIHLIEKLRQRENGVFINLTTGTKPSPFWLAYADSIWRSGEDHDFDGEGSWRQRWITYRDEQTYRNIVQRGPLFPLNSLMLHGIIYAAKAEHLATDPGHDFTAEVHSYFGTGTQLQEMYITPSLLSPSDWDTLAEGAKWSRGNAATLRDTHWVGGDPGKGEVYGWASWSRAKGILTLRNPTSKPQTMSIDVQQAFELPPEAAKQFRARSPWSADKGKPAINLTAKQPHAFALQPFEVMTLEALPVQ
jgi:hypothetical protein